MCEYICIYVCFFVNTVSICDNTVSSYNDHVSFAKETSTDHVRRRAWVNKYDCQRAFFPFSDLPCS